MKDMKANASFAQREKNSAVHAVESIPSKATESMTIQFPKLKPVRQYSLPDSSNFAHHNRRSSESEVLKQTRKNVVGELSRYTIKKTIVVKLNY